MHREETRHREILEISGADISKCMKCGKCSASCPSFNEMDLRPHQFAAHLLNRDVDAMLAAESLWRCAGCHACVERCPRDVRPARLIEAARLMVIRAQGGDHLSPDDVPNLIDDKTPAQLLVAAFRKYRR